MSGKSLPPTAIPLQVRWHESDDQEKRELSVIQTPRNLQTSCVPFRLPDDWIVEERPRSSSTGSRRHVDRYYYEPGTGRKFRSLVSVQKHLMEGTRETKRVKSEKKPVQAATQTRGCTFGLPDNWIVEEKRRKYVGVTDRTYIESETGQRFRSLLAVQRYLGEDNGFTATAKPFSKHGSEKQSASGENCSAEAVGKHSKVAEEDEIYLKSLKLKSKNYKKPGSFKKTGLDKDNKASMVDLSCPPAKVEWVLSGDRGFWTPFLDGSKVPESVKQKWSDAFVSYIQDGDANEPRC
ncbi:methyl-CpG-binding domain-containing protein 7-like isoform X3 [Neltuma alba]|uniref:methyl-CpG-binding domain-containing protein 7-like isoform X3 n=1 Tax=Neltuma alba TaxID=207710 RepID=UPI0010A5898C|nr:methyl-CpG-binding domain-containing protein 7-like isoform X3 [Prosopis alba]